MDCALITAGGESISIIIIFSSAVSSSCWTLPCLSSPYLTLSPEEPPCSSLAKVKLFQDFSTQSFAQRRKGQAKQIPPHWLGKNYVNWIIIRKESLPRRYRRRLLIYPIVSRIWETFEYFFKGFEVFFPVG